MPRIPHIGKITGGAAAGAALIAGIFVHGHEGREYRTYFDIAHVATICDGHTGKDVKPRQVADDTMCDALLTADLQTAFNAVDRYVVRPEELPPYTRAAAADFVLRLGAENFRTSTFLRLLNVRQVQAACDSLLWWDKYRDPKTGQLVISQGLMNRSRDEQSLCLGEMLP